VAGRIHSTSDHQIVRGPPLAVEFKEFLGWVSKLIHPIYCDRWLLIDHLGSTAYTFNGATKSGEVRYRAFGAGARWARFTSGTTPTTYRRVPPGIVELAREDPVVPLEWETRRPDRGSLASPKPMG
jgi:hypothetical protein